MKLVNIHFCNGRVLSLKVPEVTDATLKYIVEDSQLSGFCLIHGEDRTV